MSTAEQSPCQDVKQGDARLAPGPCGGKLGVTPQSRPRRPRPPACHHHAFTATPTSACWRERPLTGNSRSDPSGRSGRTGTFDKPTPRGQHGGRWAAPIRPECIRRGAWVCSVSTSAVGGSPFGPPKGRSFTATTPVDAAMLTEKITGASATPPPPGHRAGPRAGSPRRTRGGWRAPWRGSPRSRTRRR